MKSRYYEGLRFDRECPVAFYIRGVAEKYHPKKGEWRLDFVAVDPENSNRYTATFSHSDDSACRFVFTYTLLPNLTPGYQVDILERTEPQEL